MAHQFTIHQTISGVTIDRFAELAADISLHEAVCRRIPGENLEILESIIVGDIYTMRSEYNLAVHIQEIAKKLLKNAFRLKRSDIANLKKLTSTIELGANLPLEAKAERKVVGNRNQLDTTLVWTVKVKVPLIGGMLEKHAEGEIRKLANLKLILLKMN